MAFAIRLHLHFLLFSKDSNERLIIITDLFSSLVSTGAIITGVRNYELIGQQFPLTMVIMSLYFRDTQGIHKQVLASTC